MNIDVTFDVILVKESVLDKSKPVYICGPMRGRFLHNFPNFFRVANKLREQGYVVYNPAEADMADCFCPTYPDVETEENNARLRDIIKRDVELVSKSGTIIVLPGWSTSDGSLIEIQAAQDIGIKIVYCKSRVDTYADGCYNVLCVGEGKWGDEGD